MMEQMLARLGSRGYPKLVYKFVPFIYHSVPRQEDQYVLWRAGARTARRTLSACIDMRTGLPSSSRRKRSLAKALKAGCRVEIGPETVPQFWPVVESILMERHGVRPAHTLDEILVLMQRFPDNIMCLTAMMGESIMAGVILFHSPTVTHVQYSVSASAGAAMGAMDALIDRSLSLADERRSRYFDLGISTDPAGSTLNEGLHRFKMEFGAGTVVYEQCEVDLSSDA
jgi:hypothetical protein